MTAIEQKQLINILNHIQQEYERLVGVTKNLVVEISVPGTDFRQVYSGRMAVSVCRSLARTMESERMSLVARRMNENAVVL